MTVVVDDKMPEMGVRTKTWTASTKWKKKLSHYGSASTAIRSWSTTTKLLDMAQLVGKSGRVIASDLQEGMLQKLTDKIQG